jgi:uncharacterized protein YjaZ
MVGLFTADGWGAILRGKPASFIALEFFIKPQQLDILIAHEAAHSLHALCQSSIELRDFAIGETLFLEGLATVASSIVCSGASEVDYLAVGQPDYDDWVAQCTSRWSELRQRFLEELAKIDESLSDVYFRGKGPEVGLPKRVGYFVGYRVVTVLTQRYTIAEMARWLPEHAVAEVKQVLEQMTDG